jgi:kumamolisin
MARRSIHVIAFLAVLFAFVATPVCVSANQARYSGNFGSVIGSVNLGAEKYFTVHMREGSTPRDAAIVAQYFRKFGLAISLSPDSKVLFAHGSYGQAGAAANTGFVRVQLNGMQFTRTSRPETFPPLIASRILVTTISDGPSMHANNVFKPAGVSPFGILVAPGGGYTPANIATYYDYTPIYSAGFKGTGRNVAIVSCGTVLTGDIMTYESLFGIPSNLPTIVSVDGGSPTQDLEPTLDVEREIGTANAVKVFLYVVPLDCSFAHFADGIAKVEADNPSKHFDSLNISYGATEDIYDASGSDAFITSQHADLVDLFPSCWTFVSSGDSGAFPSSADFLEDGEVTVQYPASDDHVIAVGGTTASSKSPTIIARNKELGWGGSGGGVSGKFALPGWQVGVPGLESTTHRNVPDVSFDADINTGYDIIFTPPGMAQGAFIVGGTSASAPTWAATLALVQQKRVALGKAKLAGVAGTIYKASTIAGNFFDVTIGDNGFYANKVGYDAVTGVGSPDAFKLWTYLAITTP